MTVQGMNMYQPMVVQGMNIYQPMVAMKFVRIRKVVQIIQEEGAAW